MQSQPNIQPTKKMVSRAVALILLIVGVAIGAGVAYAGLLAGGQVNGGGGLCSSGKTLTIGVLTDLTDGLTSQGVRAKYAAMLAVSDINAYLASAKCNVSFKASVSDYQLDSSIALTQLQAFAAAGVQVVVGPLNSGALQNIIQYSNTNHIVLISPSSTSAALAIPASSTKYYFRTAPDDRWQGMADARMAQAEGATKLIVVQRHDTYGDALANATAYNFNYLVTNGSGTVDKSGCVSTDTVCIIQYDKNLSDFTSIITNLSTEFNALNSTTAMNKVGISDVAFEEFSQMIAQMKSQHPNLLTGKLPGCGPIPGCVGTGTTTMWMGTDGQSQDTVISSNSTAAGYFTTTRLPSTIYGFLNNTKTTLVDNTFASGGNGLFPSGNVCDNYCRGTYDDTWLAALATISAGAYDGTKIQAVMLTTAANYYGVTGWNGLDSNGDRLATIYQIWKVVPTGSSFTWTYAGSWTADTTPNSPGTLSGFDPY